MVAPSTIVSRCTFMMALVLCAVCGRVAHADIVVSIERITDQRAIVSAMGTLTTFDNLGGRAIFRFVDDPLRGALPATTTSHTLSDNSLVAGSTTLIDASTLVGSPALPGNFFFRMSGQPTDGSTLGGQVQVDLNAQMWASVGTSGNVIWGNATNRVGTWTIVSSTSIPEPTAIPVLAVLASVVTMMRRQRGFETPFQSA